MADTPKSGQSEEHQAKPVVVDEAGLKSAGTAPPRRRSRKILYIAIAAAVVVVLGLALGLGLGLGLKDHGGRGDENEPSGPTPSEPPVTPNGTVWQPPVGAKWQIILNSVLDVPSANAKTTQALTPDVPVWDFDMFLHRNTNVISNLHSLGKRAICYFSAGSYEPYTPDNTSFVAADLGKTMDGWPDEKWLDIRRPSVRNIMLKRLDIAASMKCDAVDPDNVDGYQNANGLGLTKQDTIDFVRFLGKEASKRGLAMGLKNAGEVIEDVLDVVQFSVNEQCAQYNECDTFEKFTAAGKPVFHIEYPSGAPKAVKTQDSRKLCGATGADRFSTVLKGMDLDAWVEYCDGNVAETKVANTSDDGSDDE
ncbi:glycoside hydrolase family 114 protein [Neurospora crassa]|uniref:alpha-galactosidase n=2 Tax=Neurospora crassa TaxID=5141 RepID=Q1K5A3_NEUCR|nr:endo alpha-1,4 polygalactosaminidase precursor [Neurospora crassa OR74A]EAA27398.1 endo alpha-1,4 polygalactosaminidase precursor [Neurospora crassa OR74A]KHE88006.1 glycoside hydrolase family 114 protein [Neurospora crassa]CAD70543.1 hypothetical protein [Neurospora crassa]|eukprot:XP_956634.1 endo alpha-1,4 polygalactosaminidase precursor [Neurospora crassa OR74A]